MQPARRDETFSAMRCRTAQPRAAQLDGESVPIPARRLSEITGVARPDQVSIDGGHGSMVGEVMNLSAVGVEVRVADAKGLRGLCGVVFEHRGRHASRVILIGRFAGSTADDRGYVACFENHGVHADAGVPALLEFMTQVLGVRPGHLASSTAGSKDPQDWSVYTVTEQRPAASDRSAPVDHESATIEDGLFEQFDVVLDDDPGFAPPDESHAQIDPRPARADVSMNVVLVVDDRTTPARIRNVSEAGISIALSPGAEPPGSGSRVRLEVPIETALGMATLAVDAEPRWHRQIAGEPEHVVGLSVRGFPVEGHRALWHTWVEDLLYAPTSG